MSFLESAQFDEEEAFLEKLHRHGQVESVEQRPTDEIANENLEVEDNAETVTEADKKKRELDMMNLLDDSDDEIDHKEADLKKKLKQEISLNRGMKAEEEIGNERPRKRQKYELPSHMAAPNEVPIEPFNMKVERSTGYFDQFMNFHERRVRLADRGIWDNWCDKLEDTEDHDKTNFALARKHETIFGKQQAVLNKKDMNLDLPTALGTLVCHMETCETVHEAIRRLGKHARIAKEKDRANRNLNAKNSSQKAKRKWRNRGIKELPTKKKAKRRKKRSWEVESEEEANEVEVTESAGVPIQEALLQFTEAVNNLVSVGLYSIYEESKEKLQRKLSVEKVKRKKEEEQRMNVDPTKSLPPRLPTDPGPLVIEGPPMWEYKTRESPKIHGPYTPDQITSFHEQKHFKTEVLLRTVGSKDWISSNELDLELL